MPLAAPLACPECAPWQAFITEDLDWEADEEDDRRSAMSGMGGIVGGGLDSLAMNSTFVVTHLTLTRSIECPLCPGFHT